MNWRNNQVSISFDNQTETATWCCRFRTKRLGSHCKRKTQTVQKANYAFIGIPIEKGRTTSVSFITRRTSKLPWRLQSSASSSESGTAEGEKAWLLNRAKL
ncbi:hypothetical protein PO124_28825 [Bacillus licheniformis]|nr:hypothetical protein [Bacillus licheniformis]